MRVVFFGSPDSAVYSLRRVIEEGHHVGLVITKPDKPAGRGKKLLSPPVKRFAQEKGIPIYQPLKIRRDPDALEKLKEFDPDINVIVAYGQILPASLIYYPKYNSINAHFSLLPKYRGASPVHWCILNGEERTGVTIFELNEKMDEGDILTVKETPILPGEYAVDLELRLAKIGAELLCQTLDNIDKIQKIAQDHSRATFAPLLSKGDGKVDWTEDASAIDRKIRAFTPWPSAYSFFNKKRIKFIKGKKQEDQALKGNPGEILGVSQAGILVRCGQTSAYLVEELQPEGKNAMRAYAFSLGSEISKGKKFS
jgi:methionyl-tRNA formyltransferase